MNLSKEGIKKYNEGKLNEAVTHFLDYLKVAKEKKINILASDYVNVALCYYESKKLSKTVEYIEKALELDTENLAYKRFLGLTLCTMTKYEEGFFYLKQVNEKKPESVIGLYATFYHKIASREESIPYGIKKLQNQDKKACEEKNMNEMKQCGFEFRKIDIPKYSSNRKENVVSFSLWGDNPLYTEGALLNAQMIPVIYQDWIARFYCAEDTNKTLIEKLINYGSQVILIKNNTQIYKGLFWRFSVADDPSVKRYMIRDIDSLPTVQERLAIDQWIESEEYFHIIRDHFSHCTVINAGMFAGISRVLNNWEKAFQWYYQKSKKERTIDQRFLQNCVWPLIKNYCLTHDDYFKFGTKVIDYPKFGRNNTHNVIAKRWRGYYKNAQ